MIMNDLTDAAMQGLEEIFRFIENIPRKLIAWAKRLIT